MPGSLTESFRVRWRLFVVNAVNLAVIVSIIFTLAVAYLIWYCCRMIDKVVKVCQNSPPNSKSL